MAAEDLVCGSCSALGSLECKEHGTEGISFKCRFCCSIATYCCWDKTHVRAAARAAHAARTSLTPFPRARPPARPPAPQFCNACHSGGVWDKLVNHGTGVNKLAAPTGAFTARGYPSAGAFPTEYIACPALAPGGRPSDCPLGILHPPSGTEYGLGCSMCQRDGKQLFPGAPPVAAPPGDGAAGAAVPPGGA